MSRGGARLAGAGRLSATRRPLLLAWSGGKDAAWSLHVLRQRDDMEVVGLLSTVSQDDGRATLQGVRGEVLRAQARAAGLPLLEVALPAASSNAEYGQRMSGALEAAAARWPGLDTVAFGDLLLAEVRDWRAAQMARIGWRIETPLFGSDTAALARPMLRGGLGAALSCVDTQQIDAGFSGRTFDARLLADLPAGVDPCGENGEFHTCVHAGPMFAAPVELVRGASWRCDPGDAQPRPPGGEGRFAVTDFVPAAAGGDQKPVADAGSQWRRR